MTDDHAPADEPLVRAYADRPAATMVHPDEATWERFACGELAPTERSALADHLGRCAECLAVYRAVVAVVTDAGTFDPDRPASAPESRAATGRTFAGVRWWQGAALAATVALAIAGAVYYTSSPATPAVEPVATGVAPATPVTTLLAFEAPDVRLPASLTVTMRGAPGSTDRERFLDAFGAAMVPYRAREYDAAAQALRGVTSRFPDVQEAWVYLGVSELLSARPAEALAAFAAARDGGVLNVDLPWYVAAAHERRGDEAARAAALRKLCDGPGPYTARACAALGTGSGPR